MADGAELARKLQIKAGQSLRLIKAPADIAQALAAAGLKAPAPDGRAQAVLAFCESADEVKAASAEALKALEPDGLLWFAYRKGKAGLNRDTGWAPLTEAGYRGVRQVSIDDTWTGTRFRESSKVKAS